jgi:hypothetical protein
VKSNERVRKPPTRALLQQWSIDLACTRHSSAAKEKGKKEEQEEEEQCAQDAVPAAAGARKPAVAQEHVERDAAEAIEGETEAAAAAVAGPSSAKEDLVFITLDDGSEFIRAGTLHTIVETILEWLNHTDVSKRKRMCVYVYA